MQLGMIGLGRMGANMVRRLMRAGHNCVVYDVNADHVQALAHDGATGTRSLEDFVARLSAPRAVWLAHLSEQNNSQKHALQTVGRILRRRGLGHVPLKTTHHRRSNLRWSSTVGRERQLPLF